MGKPILLKFKIMTDLEDYIVTEEQPKNYGRRTYLAAALGVISVVAVLCYLSSPSTSTESLLIDGSDASSGYMCARYFKLGGEGAKCGRRKEMYVGYAYHYCK